MTVVQVLQENETGGSPEPRWSKPKATKGDLYLKEEEEEKGRKKQIKPAIPGALCLQSQCLELRQEDHQKFKGSLGYRDPGLLQRTGGVACFVGRAWQAYTKLCTHWVWLGNPGVSALDYRTSLRSARTQETISKNKTTSCQTKQPSICHDPMT